MNIPQLVLDATGKFMMRCTQRWDSAVQAAREQKYTGDKLVSDVVSCWADMYEMWTLAPGTDATPSIVFSFTVAQAKRGDLQSKTVVVKVGKDQPTVTTLERVGGGKSRIMATAHVADDGQMAVTLSAMEVDGTKTTSWGGADLEPGLYAGVVYRGEAVLASVNALVRQ